MTGDRGSTGPLPQAAQWRLSCSRVPALGPRLAPQVAEQFTPVERACSGAGRGLEGFAGRLAAKRAVAQVLGVPPDDRGLLRRIQIVPRPRHTCRNPALCRRGHPPAVVLEPGSRIGDSGSLLWIDVSVSHEREHAFAASLAVFAAAPEG